MKHGAAFRKFSRTSSHRMLMLRNLVTSLFEHEQIKTTLPKARDAARLAEKMITLGKDGTIPAHHRASAFLLKPDVLTKVFGTFAKRYEERPGGYTRIHKFGHRPGDNAPHAILELVDNPRDLRLEMTARAVGREFMQVQMEGGMGSGVDKKRKGATTEFNGAAGVRELLKKERALGVQERGLLRPKTRWNLQKVLRFRDPRVASTISEKIQNHIDFLMAKPAALKSLHPKRVLTHI